MRSVVGGGAGYISYLFHIYFLFISYLFHIYFIFISYLFHIYFIFISSFISYLSPFYFIFFFLSISYLFPIHLMYITFFDVVEVHKADVLLTSLLLNCCTYFNILKTQFLLLIQPLSYIFSSGPELKI